MHGRRALLASAIALTIGLVLPLVVYPGLAINLVCFALFAVAFDLLLGFTGLLSFGHALFFGGSAYVTTILIAKSGLAVAPALLLGVVYSFALSALVGAISIRRQGIYFAMITLALAQLQFFVAFQLTDWTGGENGVQISAVRSILGLPLDRDIAFYYFVLAVAAVGTFFAIRVVNSPFGAVLAAMRENETRARSIGYDVDRFKLITFVMSGTLAGVAGSLYALGNRLAGLDAVDWHTSGKVVMMTILGGIGTIFGPIAGAGIFESLDYFVSKTAIGDKTNVVMGTIFAAVILLARRGIVGELLHATLAKQPRLVEDEEHPDRLVADPSREGT